jgi:hypothetical protein
LKGIRISKWLLGEILKVGAGPFIGAAVFLLFRYYCQFTILRSLAPISYSSFHVVFVLILKQGLTPLRCNASFLCLNSGPISRVS